MIPFDPFFSKKVIFSILNSQLGLELMLADVKSHWRDHYSINFNNYSVEDAYTPKIKVVNGA